jgi:hypothetical protein
MQHENTGRTSDREVMYLIVSDANWWMKCILGKHTELVWSVAIKHITNSSHVRSFQQMPRTFHKDDWLKIVEQ